MRLTGVSMGICKDIKPLTDYSLAEKQALIK